MRLCRLNCAPLFSILFALYTSSFFTSSAHAEITLNSVGTNRASAVIGIPKEDNVTPTIFAGTAGTICDSVSSTSTCNNCDSENLSLSGACNENRVHASLNLVINFTSNSKSGTAILGDSSGNDLVGVTEENVVNVSSGQQASVTVPWSQLCASSEIDAGADCEGDKSAQISVGIDGNGDGDLADSDDDRTSVTIIVQNTISDQIQVCPDGESDLATGGLCDFSVFPGDEKVFIQNLSVPSGFPAGDSTAKLDKIRFYFVTVTTPLGDSDTGQTTFDSIDHASTSSEFTIEKDDSGNLSTNSDSIDGLINGQEYFFTAATVDQAGNIGWAIPTLNLEDSSQYLTRNTHSTTPQEVTGLLSEDVQCFIATAAYGSPFQKHVKTLRQFRDEILKKTWLGRQAVEAYYFFSPKIADQIRSSALLRELTRWALWPLVKASELFIHVGWQKLQMMLAGFFILGLALILRMRRRSH